MVYQDVSLLDLILLVWIGGVQASLVIRVHRDTVTTAIIWAWSCAFSWLWWCKRHWAKAAGYG